MSIRTEIESAIDEMLADLHDLDDTTQKFSIHFGGPSGQETVDIEGIPSYAERGLVIGIGGAEAVVALTIICTRSQFVSADSTALQGVTADSTTGYTGDMNKPHPIAGKKVTFRGKHYKVALCAEDPSRAFYKITLVDTNSGK